MASHPNLGVLLTPNDGNVVPAPGVVWAADNSAFSGFDAERFRAFLARIAGPSTCLWVAAPDVVGDAEATLRLWGEWRPIIEARGHRPALVAQNGLTVALVPWDEVPALFVGGSPWCAPCRWVRPASDHVTTRCPFCRRLINEWKTGPEAAALVAEANRRGVWVHMGRVNTRRRILFAAGIGCQSVDGSSFSRYSRTHLPWALRTARQRPLFSEVRS